MPKPLQLHIPTPCHEDWSKMTPAGQGRHCAACQKTVVDFTGMSDTEIIRHMTLARSGVCGRLAPHQLHRNLVPMSPIQRNGAKGWQWLLAGLLFTADGSLPDRRPWVMGEMHVRLPQPQKVDSVEDDGIMGLMAIPAGVEAAPTDTVVESRVDTSGDIMGEMTLIALDSIHVPPEDTTALLQPASRCEPADSLADKEDNTVYTGGITVTRSNPIDSVKQFVKDTLTALHILPKKELKVYPNPISRGSILHIAWQSEPGEYKVSLFSTAGALIRTHVVEVGSSIQVDSWEIPGGLAAGAYIIQAIRPGQTGGLTQKIVVE